MSSCTCRCPKCQPSRLVTRPLGPSVQASGPSFTAPGPSARLVLLDLHLAVDHRIRAPHLHNTSQKTCRTHSFHHGRVSHHSTYFVDHIDNHSSQNEHKRVLLNLVFATSRDPFVVKAIGVQVPKCAHKVHTLCSVALCKRSSSFF
jgi:hypothetical protein